MLVLNQCVLKQSVGSAFNPADLFLAGGTGFFIDFDIANTALKKDASNLVTADNDVLDRTVPTYYTGTSGEFRAVNSNCKYRTGTYPYMELGNNTQFWTTWDGGWGLPAAYEINNTTNNGGSQAVTVIVAMRPQNSTHGWFMDYIRTNPNIEWDASGKLQVTRRRHETDGSQQYAQSSSGYAGTDVVATVIYDFSASGNSIKGRINGTEVISTTPLSTGDMTGGSYQSSINEDDNSPSTALRFYAFLAITRVLSAGELSSVEAWMKARAGIA